MAEFRPLHLGVPSLALWKFSHFLEGNQVGSRECNSTNTYRSEKEDVNTPENVNILVLPLDLSVDALL